MCNVMYFYVAFLCTFILPYTIVHEGWGKRHPSSSDYELKNKSYWETLESGQVFWEEFSRYLYEKYEITNDTHIVINGDGAPWIRNGIEIGRASCRERG